MPPDPQTTPHPTPISPQHLNNIGLFDAASTFFWPMCVSSPQILFLRGIGAAALALRRVNNA
jgi:hypothetical protein